MGLFRNKYKKIESNAESIQPLIPMAQSPQIIMPQPIQQLSPPIMHRQSPLPDLTSNVTPQSVTGIPAVEESMQDMEDKIKLFKAIADLEDWKHFITEKVFELEMKISNLKSR